MTGESIEVVQLERAAFVVSIDVEMAWGLVHRKEQVYRYDDERRHLGRLLRLFDQYRILATWAVVGHLMLDQCAPVGGVKHPEIVRPDYSWHEGDWFDDDPCSAADQAPTWYAPDVVKMIQSAQTPQEIASHGFSHIVAGDPGCSRQAFDSELRAAVSVAAERGITLRSLIHPRNRTGHVDLLDEHGIAAYRGRTVAGGGRLSPWQKAVDLAVGSERTTVLPVREGRVWNLPATIFFNVDARARTWRLWIRQVERRLDQAVARRSLFHLWFHPHNFRDRPDASFAALERICRRAALHRESGVLDTVTMGRLASELSTATHL